MIGSLAASGIVTFAVVGVLVGVIIFMKFKADLKFRTVLITVAKQRVLRPLRMYWRTTYCGRPKKKKPKKIIRKTIEINLSDVGVNLHYNKKGSIGVMTRIIEETGVAQVLRVLPGSVAYGAGIKPLWELLEINGIPKRYESWRDAVDDLNNSPKKTKVRGIKTIDKSWPLQMTFNINVPKVKTEKHGLSQSSEEDKVVVKDLYRTVIMSVAMANQFKALATTSIEWPAIMLKISFAFSFFSFNLNFVRPECSAKVAFWKTWLGFAMFPYAMLIPFWVSYMLSCKIAIPGSNRYQKMLMGNAFLRTLCQVELILLPMHFQKVFSPFICEPQLVGPPLLKEQPAVLCDDSDSEYWIISRAANFCLAVLFLVFLFLWRSLKLAYKWQYGNMVRNSIPTFVGLMGLATEGHKGLQNAV